MLFQFENKSFQTHRRKMWANPLTFSQQQQHPTATPIKIAPRLFVAQRSRLADAEIYLCQD